MQVRLSEETREKLREANEDGRLSKEEFNNLHHDMLLLQVSVCGVCGCLSAFFLIEKSTSDLKKTCSSLNVIPIYISNL